MPIRTLLIAVLVAAVAATVLDARAPALRAAAPKISVSRICDDSVNAIEAAYGRPDRSVTTGPVLARAASYPLTAPPAKPLGAPQAKIVATKEKQATADCASKLHKATTAGWSYLTARAVEIAVDAVVTILASTLICSLTGPAGCKWGVRIASFTGGFVGALAFQYLTDGYLNWKSVGGAFFDATVSMLAFSGLDKLDEKYVGQGVRATFKELGNLLKTVGNRIGSAGPAMVGSIQNAADYILTHATTWAFPAAYTGGGSVEPVIAEKRGDPIADGLQFRIPHNASGADVHDDLFSGNWNHPYYNWDVAETPHTNKDGAVGYLIGQGNQCLGYTGGYAVLKTCNYNDHTQWWFVDGDELMADTGQCMGEVENAQSRMMGSCDGLNVRANPENFDDQFIVTPPGGTYIPDTVSNWKSHLSYYEHA
ncbi:hypothetical protein ACIRP7_14435 [Streptomyces sp. NPDC102270]|uniref:hypothetical protein n=1 Tax=Streptomyces sp. NPDC102270 TaxID=3366150 RepID=UPI00381C6E12